MNILIYANDSKALSRMISGIWFMQYRNIDFSMPKDYDAYLAALGEESPDIIFISLPGALGMEGRRQWRQEKPAAARILCGSAMMKLSERSHTG